MAVPVPSLLRSSSTGAITLAQFTDVLERTWAESRRFRPGMGTVLPRRLGLAVSGGADSMALAYLCREWEKNQQQSHGHTPCRNIDETNKSDNNDLDVSVTAFIVDHKARSESTQEANTVASWLQNLGLRTSILPLTWPQGSLTSSAFETHARRLRYRALGEACRERGIEALLMGHHQDDNVETTIWRLASGAKGAAGLTGIPGLARIPECHGLWGVAESGRGISVSPGDLIADVAMGKKQEQQRHCHQEGNRNQIQIATGGIYISRPLLSFRKSSLIATCAENGVPFVDDPTNFDPTLTPRNAIRSMLSSDSLPRALTNPSILALIERAQERVKESYQLSDKILENGCRLLDVNFGSGAMTVQFSPSALNLFPSVVQGNQERKQEQEQPSQETLALALRRITEFISPFPENHWPLSSFANFTDRVFLPPSHMSSAFPESEKYDTLEPATASKAFTVGGVFFQPLPLSPSPSSSLSSKTKGEITPKNGLTTWLLSCQPYFRNRAPILHLNLSLSTQPNKGPLYTPWTLWDNRFWIRAAAVPVHSNPELDPDHHQEGRTQIPIVIRPLQQADISVIRQVDAARKGARKEKLELVFREDGASAARRVPEPEQRDEAKLDARAFLSKLSAVAPAQSRFTVPVLALEDADWKESRPLVIPTMDFLFPDLGINRKAWTIRWEWKYKLVDLKSLGLMGLV
ncbi:hypothetical protein BJY01DRAFT_15102 [Aspergillus pseudoustus]|uniref:tRNA(Ile)-lysidine synthetase n=1 Tax=Aspergillus pseudoustus TaxID=1810923 RepID=A0ABR4JLS1_9EURO